MPDVRSLPLFDTEPLADGLMLLPAFADTTRLYPLVEAVLQAAPARHMLTPGGHAMSAAMSNCGPLGWVSDRRGYRYQATDPETGAPWPAMPAVLKERAIEAAALAGFRDFDPDACLINRYEPGARMGLHQDKDEADFSQPVVTLSMGLAARFQLGGPRRADPSRDIELHDGDVLVLGGTARLCYHGVRPVAEGRHPLTGHCRISLTFRRARPLLQRSG